MIQDSRVKVSVIVTVHNSGEFLQKCLATLADQDLSDIEIVIVNDCSPDERDEEIVEKFRAVHGNVIYIRNPVNLGTGRTREIGIGVANGEYIGFLDSDDYVEPYAYRLLYDYARDCDAEIAVANFRNVSGWDVDTKNNAAPKDIKFEVTSGASLFESQIYRINRPYYLRVDWWNKIYKKSLFVENKVSLPRVVRNEGTMSMIMSLLARNCVIVDHPVFYTTSRPESVCRTFRKKNIADILASTNHFRDWLIRLGVFEKYRDVFIKFFYFIVFDHNLKLISRLGKVEREDNCKLLLDEIRKNSVSRRDFLRYLNIREKSTGRLVYGTINTKSYNYSILSKIKETDFFQREVGGRHVNFDAFGKLLQPEVSVITICKDIIKSGRQEYFERMVSSVLGQTLSRSKIEHIVVDAASADGTVPYLRKLHSQRKLDFFVSEPDSGIYNAMNKASMLAHGKYLIFLNSDDFLETTALEKLKGAIEFSGADYAFSNAHKVDEHERKVGAHVGDLNKVFFGAPYCHQTLLCKRETFASAYFDEDYRITMWSYALKLYDQGFKGIHVPEYLAYFRVGGVSTDKRHANKFSLEQKRIKIEAIVPRLPIDFEEYEFLEQKFRKRPVTSVTLDEGEILAKISSSPSVFVQDFFRAYKALTV